MSPSNGDRRKKYPQAIANWPAEERPREKLLLKGPEFLTNAELLAIFLRVGVKGKTAIGLAQELLSRFGSLRELYAAPVEELEGVLGVGPAKIALFKAITELSKRYLDLVFACRLMGVKVHDHIIIGDNDKFSFADAGLIEQYDKNFDARNVP